MEEVRRSADGELCGFVAEGSGGWSALSVFGAALGAHEHKSDAVAQVHDEGLASLAERWVLDRLDGESETVVCVVEANPTGVMLALDYYALPGVPTVWVSSAEILDGSVRLRRETFENSDTIPASGAMAETEQLWPPRGTGNVW
jgi:hypothetical protein